MDPSAGYSYEGIARGLEGIVVAKTSLSFVDGQESALYYRGIPIQELPEKSHYEEVVFLLWNGILPKAQELEDFKRELGSRRFVDEKIIDVIKAFPKEAHPMGVLRSMVSMLGLFDPEVEKADFESKRCKAMRLTAAFPTLIAAHFRIREGKKPIPPDPALSHAANFLYMMHGKPPDSEAERALDTYLILLADHGLNASTFAARVTTSTQSDIYSAIVAAIGTLKGHLHGAANQRTMEMLLEIKKPENAEPYVRDLLAQKEKIMGFGHRIYKHQDPRAPSFQAIAHHMCVKTGNKAWIEIMDRVEKIMLEEKNIPCNVDFYSAPVLYILGFPVDFLTTVFAASRVAGWTAHVIEQWADNKLIRPTSSYIGPKNQHYVPMEQRG